jgi:hypothetical protein
LDQKQGKKGGDSQFNHGRYVSSVTQTQLIGKEMKNGKEEYYFIMLRCSSRFVLRGRLFYRGARISGIGQTHRAEIGLFSAFALSKYG